MENNHRAETIDCSSKQYFLHPITLEAELFARKLEELRSNSSIDKELLAALNRVSINIEFLRERNTAGLFTPNNNKIYMTPFEIKDIEKVFRCQRCLQYFDNNTQQAVNHIINNHPKPICQKPSLNDLNKTLSSKKKKKLDKKFDGKPLDIQPMSRKTLEMIKSSPFVTIKEMIELGDKLKIIPDYKCLEDELKTLLNETFPGKLIQIYRFGSRPNGLGGRDSDLDIYIDIQNTFHILDNVKTKKTLKMMAELANALEYRKNRWDRIIRIDKARVPIIKVRHISTFLNCDISLSNSMGVMNNYLLEYFFNEQPITRWLCLYLKKFCKLINLSHCFSTIGIVVMVIFYLQTKKLLPTIEYLQRDVTDANKILVGPWLCSFNKIKFYDVKIPVEKTTNDNLKLHLTGFFQYYINFNYENNVICIYNGQVVPLNKLQNHMPERFIVHNELNTTKCQFLSSAMMAQAPFQLNHNVIGKVSKRVLDIFIFYSQTATKLINHDHQS